MSRRHSPAVYRRRRLAVFGGLLLVLAGIGVGIWLLIAQPWQAQGSEPPEKTPVVTDTASDPGSEPEGDEGDEGSEDAEGETGDDAGSDPEAGAEPEIGVCTGREVTVEPVTDATSYRSGVNPQLSISLTNSSAHDCTMNVGSSTQVFTIRSGNDIWWRSTDCQEEPSDMIVTLEAGQTVTSAAPVEWNRTRSAVNRCGDSDRQRAPGRGASYHLSVEIGGVSSSGTKQIFLH